MKTSTALAAAITLLAGTAHLAAQGDVFLIDFGDAQSTFKGDPAFGEDPDNEWNNFPTSAGTDDLGIFFDLINTAGTVFTDTNIEMIARFNGQNTAGLTGTGLYPDSATSDSLFGNTETFGGQENVFPSFKITNLDPALAYNLSFYGSRNAGDNRETAYTVTGSSTGFATLDIAGGGGGNIDQTAEVLAVVPDENNEIRVDITPGPNNNNGNHFTYLGVLRIESTTAPDAVTIVTDPQAPLDILYEFQPVTFFVSATGAPPLSYQWYRNDELIPGATGPSYTIDETPLAYDGSVFKAVVSNATSNATSAGTTLFVDPDFDFPVFQSTYTIDGLTVFAIFSEPVVDPGATDLANYAVSSTAGPATITGATLDATRTIVTLTVESALVGQYSVVANNVEDRAGNAIDIDETRTSFAPDPSLNDILVDFGGAASTRGDFPDDPNNDWNNVSNGMGVDDFGLLVGLITQQGDFTDYDLEMVARFNGTNTNGDPNSGRYPASASGDSLYGNTELWNELTDIFPSFKLTRLDTSRAYTLRLYASRMGPTDNRETGYTVTGANGEVFAAFDPVNNDRDDLTVFEAVTPTAEGEIIIAIAPTENNNNNNHFTYLNVLEISETDPTVEPPTTPFRITLVDYDSVLGTLSLTWNSASGTTYAIEELVAGSWQTHANNVAGQPDSTTFLINGIDPATTPHRIFRVVVQP